MSSTRVQRLAHLRNHYELLAHSVSAIPLLDGTGEPWRAVYEGRLCVLTMTSAALTQIPMHGQILVALKAVRDQLAALQQADLALITHYGRPAEATPREVWHAHGSIPTRAAALRDVEALLPKKWRTQSGSTSPLSLVKIRWTENADPCAYCQMPAFTQIPDEMGGLVLCQEHLAPLVTLAARRAIIKRLETQLGHRADLYCTVSLPGTVVEHDVVELCRYYTTRWLLAVQRTEDAIAYHEQHDPQREEEAGLQISIQEGTSLSLEVPSTLNHRLVLLDLLIALEQADWIEESQLGPESVVVA